MRIIAGTAKGQRLLAPQGRATRPTSDRVRQALFNVIEHVHRPCEGARVLDLFAGTGALGLEALSRGAAFAAFVDNGANAIAAIERNAESLKFSDAARILRRDAAKLGRLPADLGGPFDLIFCDPPYGKGLGLPALEGALTGGWIAKDALAVLERAGAQTDAAPSGFTVLETRDYGGTHLLFLEAEGAAGAQAQRDDR